MSYEIIHNLTSYEHRVLYYGPLSVDEATSALTELHQIPEELKRFLKVEITQS